jgi:hypothetical protein
MSTPAASPEAPESRRRNPWIWISVLLAVIAVGLLVWALAVKSDRDSTQDELDSAQQELTSTKPAFWLLVPGTLGLIGITEIVGDNRDAGSENLATALAAVALGILVGTLVVRAARAATRHDDPRRSLSGSRG